MTPRPTVTVDPHGDHFVVEVCDTTGDLMARETFTDELAAERRGAQLRTLLREQWEYAPRHARGTP